MTLRSEPGGAPFIAKGEFEYKEWDGEKYVYKPQAVEILRRKILVQIRQDEATALADTVVHQGVVYEATITYAQELLLYRAIEDDTKNVELWDAEGNLQTVLWDDLIHIIHAIMKKVQQTRKIYMAKRQRVYVAKTVQALEAILAGEDRGRPG